MRDIKKLWINVLTVCTVINLCIVGMDNNTNPFIFYGTATLGALFTVGTILVNNEN